MRDVAATTDGGTAQPRHRRRAVPRRILVATGAVALTATAAAVVPALPASADTTITVTTTVDGAPGSLRAAIDTANASAQPVTIELAGSTTYDLTTCGGAPEDANVSGDLDITATQPVTITGHGATIQQLCTGARVLDHHGPGTLTLDHLTITGGNAASDASGERVGIGIRSVHLTADGLFVSGNDLTAPTLGEAVWVGGSTSSTVSLDHSSISDNAAAGLVVDTGASAADPFVLRTHVDRNRGLSSLHETGPLAAGGITVLQGTLRLDLSTVDGNIGRNATIPDLPAAADHPVPEVGGIRAPGGIDGGNDRIAGNAGTEAGGVLGTGIVLRGSLVEANRALHLGGGVNGTFDLSGLLIRGNVANLAGGGVSGNGTITGSTITANVVTGEDACCGTGGAGVHAATSGVTTIARSTVTDNEGPSVGGVMSFVDSSTHLVVHDSTLAGNTATAGPGMPKANDLLVAGTIGGGSATLARSIVGDGSSAVPSCLASFLNLVSGGSNVVTGSVDCLTSPQPTDVLGKDPHLAPPSTQIGPDVPVGPDGATRGVLPTRLPGGLSPARDLVPWNDVACTGTDERGVARPQGAGCDAGAVEAHPGRFVGQAPARVVDTRDGTGGHSGPVSGSITVDLPPMPPGTTAAVLNVTADRPSAESFLSISPPGTSVTTTASNLNFPAGRTIANLVTVGIVDPAHPQLVIHSNTGSVDVIADLAGTYVEDETAPTTGAGFSATTPKRVLDTRPGTTTGGPVGPLGPGETRTVQITGVDGIPADATAVAINLTATQTTAQSHLTAGPTGTALPTVSNLNWPAGDTIANQAIVPLGPDGAIQIRNNTGTVQVIADVAGWFTPTGGKGFRPVVPARILDTRPGSTVGGPAAPLGPGGTRVVSSPRVPAGATAVVVNLTGVTPTAATHLTAWPDGALLPTASNLNLPAGAVRPVLATVGAFSEGRFDVRNNSGAINVLADLQGYYG